MKTKEELEKLKQEYVELTKKLKELTEEELIQVTGGSGYEKERESDRNAKVIY